MMCDIDHSLAISIRTKGFLGDESCVWRGQSAAMCIIAKVMMENR